MTPEESQKECPGIKIDPFFGIDWTVYCDSDLHENDLDSASAPTVQDCVKTCEQTVGCFGATWTPTDGRCYHKTYKVQVSDLIPNQTGKVSILPNATEITQYDPGHQIACPYPNLSVQPTQSGLNFTVLCGAILFGDDMYNPAKDAYDFMIAKSLQECMEHCADHSPLCSRITYDADTHSALRFNCWLKTASQTKPVITTGGIRHSAYARVPTLKPVNCKNNSLYIAGDGRQFKMSCLDYRITNDTNAMPLSVSHADSLETCMQKCSTPNSNCSSAMFDVGMQAGYKNCYQFASMPPPRKLQTSNYTFMYLESQAFQYSAPAPAPYRSVSKGQIAATATVASLVLFTTLAIWWFWFRRRGRGGRYFAVKNE